MDWRPDALLGLQVQGRQGVPVWFFVVFACWVGLFVLLVWLSLRRTERLVRASFSGASSRLGLEYQDQWSDKNLLRLRDFSLFQRGGSKEAKYVGESNREGNAAVLMMYSYREVIGRTNSAYAQSVAFFADPIPDLPDFILLPDDLSRLLERKLTGSESIRFQDSDSGIRFSKHYEVLAENEDAVRRILGTRLVEYLSDRPRWCLESRSGQLLVWKPKWWGFLFWIKPADEVVAFFEEAKSLRSMLVSSTS